MTSLQEQALKSLCQDERATGTKSDSGIGNEETVVSFCCVDHKFEVSWCFEPSQPQRITSGLI